MTQTQDTLQSQPRIRLGVSGEFLLMLLNEETGHFRQVSERRMALAMTGAVLADLSLLSRIDTDLESLRLLDATPTGVEALDSALEQIASESSAQTAEYWIERLTPMAEPAIDATLRRMVEAHVLQHYSGDFWVLAPDAWRSIAIIDPSDESVIQFVRTRVSAVIFDEQLPSPEDIIVICLLSVCDVLQHMFELDDQSIRRIELVCRLDLIGRTLSEAVAKNIAKQVPLQTAGVRPIPKVPIHKFITNRHAREGSIPALFASLSAEFGPVFQAKIPFKEPMIFLSSSETNRWVNRRGRMHLRTRDYFQDFEQVYGAVGTIPSLDGADHFQWRKTMRPGGSRQRYEDRLGLTIPHAYKEMSTWQVGDTRRAVPMCRRLINAQFSQLHLSIETQDLIDDLIAYKERAAGTHLVKALPRFMLKTPRMRRCGRAIAELMNRIKESHTPDMRTGCPVDQIDELLEFRDSNPRLFPETNIEFALAATLLTTWYTGDQLSFAIYCMVTQPHLHEQIQREAETVLANGLPDPEQLDDSTIDVTRRFISEVLRMYPIAGVSFRTVSNSCVVEDHELKAGQLLYIVYAASHYDENLFPDPFRFDIDRYLPERKEHVSPGYAPFGVGAHMCLGYQLVEIMLAVNLMMVAHHFTIDLAPKNYKLRLSPFPAMKPSRRLKFAIKEQRHPIPSIEPAAS